MKSFECLNKLWQKEFKWGDRIELSGPSGCGKTQLALFTSLLLAKQGIRTLFLDSGCSRLERLNSFLQCELFKECKKKDLLCQISLKSVFDSVELEQQLSCCATQLKEPTVIMIDSIGDLLSPILGTTQGFESFQQLQRLALHLSCQGHLLIMLNHVVMEGNHLKPALGSKFRLPLQRWMLLFSLDDQERFSRLSDADTLWEEPVLSYEDQGGLWPAYKRILKDYQNPVS